MTTSQRTGLLSLPNELLDEIVSYVRFGNRVMMMSMCSVLHNIIAPSIYRAIVVCGSQGRASLCSIVNSKQAYGKNVFSLTLFAICECDVYLTYRLFFKAIPSLCNVQQLHITTCRKRARYFSRCFERINRVSDVNHPDHLGKNGPAFPRLHTLVIHGSPSLINFTVSQSLGTLSSTIFMTATELDCFLIKSTSTTVVNLTVRDLSLRFTGSAGKDMTSVLVCLATSFPIVEYLSLIVPQANVFDTTHLLACDSSVFKQLKGFTLNDRNSPVDREDQEWDSVHEMLQEDIECAARERHNLQSFVFGDLAFTKKLNGKWVMSTKTPPDIWGGRWSSVHDNGPFDYTLRFDAKEGFGPRRLAMTGNCQALFVRPRGFGTKCDFATLWPILD